MKPNSALTKILGYTNPLGCDIHDTENNNTLSQPNFISIAFEVNKQNPISVMKSPASDLFAELERVITLGTTIDIFKIIRLLHLTSPNLPTLWTG